MGRDYKAEERDRNRRLHEDYERHWSVKYATFEDYRAATKKGEIKIPKSENKLNADAVFFDKMTERKEQKMKEK